MLIFASHNYFLVTMNQAEGVYNQRLQNLAVTLDKVGCASPPPVFSTVILIFNVEKETLCM